MPTTSCLFHSYNYHFQYNSNIIVILIVKFSCIKFSFNLIQTAQQTRPNTTNQRLKLFVQVSVLHLSAYNVQYLPILWSTYGTF